MTKILSKLSQKYQESVANPIAQKFMGFVNNKPELFCLLLLGFLCVIFLLLGLGMYPLLDVEETRHAIMARDLAYSYNWNLLMLNGEVLFDKPPFYFWLVASAIKLFGSFDSFIVRLPIALLSSITVFATYFVGRKAISRKFGMISAIVLLTSAFFLIYSHFALLDAVLTVFTTLALYCAFSTTFCTSKYKKYLWWVFYTLVATAAMVKGLSALVIPFVVVVAYALITKTAKDVFKPLHIIPGILIMAASIVPWHLYMYNYFGAFFFERYFAAAVDVVKLKPFLYFIPLFLVGFLPWSFAFVAFIIDGFKKLGAKYNAVQGKAVEKFAAVFSVENNEQKMILFFSIYFVAAFVLFCCSSMSIPTYILPVFPAAALLTGYFWYNCDEKNENEKAVSVTTHLLAVLFMLVAFFISCAYFLAPDFIQSQFPQCRTNLVGGLYLIAIVILLRLNVKRALSIFSGYVFAMMFVIMMSIVLLFNFVYKLGENEIVNYSRYAKNADADLVTFDIDIKPSAMLEYPKNVEFIVSDDFEVLDRELFPKEVDTYVIVKNDNVEGNDKYKEELKKRFKHCKKGQKYTLYVKEGISFEQMRKKS